LAFPRDAAGAGAGAGLGAATLGAATVDAAVVVVLMGTFDSSSDSPDDESPINKDSMFCDMIAVAYLLRRRECTVPETRTKCNKDDHYHFVCEDLHFFCVFSFL